MHFLSNNAQVVKYHISGSMSKVSHMLHYRIHSDIPDHLTWYRLANVIKCCFRKIVNFVLSFFRKIVNFDTL